MPNSCRARRHALLCALLACLKRPVSLLDVGGTCAYWQDNGIPQDTQITLLNQDAISSAQVSPFSYCQGDACAMPQFADGQFDVVFSNSVIEHVGGWCKQEAMAREMRRVGRHCFVQTPAYSFPIEPHYRLPLVQFLPRRARKLVAQVGVRLKFYPARAVRNYPGIHLLTEREMYSLFPTATLWHERVGPLTKSYVAYSFD